MLHLHGLDNGETLALRHRVPFLPDSLLSRTKAKKKAGEGLVNCLNGETANIYHLPPAEGNARTPLSTVLDPLEPCLVLEIHHD